MYVSISKIDREILGNTDVKQEDADKVWNCKR